MSFQIHFDTTDRDNDRFWLISYSPDEVYVNVKIDDIPDTSASVHISKEDAPALALAILEAAGYTTEHGTPYSSIVYNLKGFIAADAKRKAEAEEAQKLDEEANAIRLALCSDILTPIEWAGLTERCKDDYRRAARKARELYGAGK